MYHVHVIVYANKDDDDYYYTYLQYIYKYTLPYILNFKRFVLIINIVFQVVSTMSNG